MEKLVKCKACGHEIAKSAKVCPHCGAKQKKPHWVLGTILIVLGLLVFILNIALISGIKSSYNALSGTVNNENNVPDKKESFSIGEKAELNGVYVTLVDVSENFWFDVASAEENGIYLICEFDIENNSDKDIAISSFASFETYIDDYVADASLMAILNSEKSALDGDIASGKKSDGVIGYEADVDWNSIEIRFKPDIASGDYITFIYSKP